MIRVQVFCEVCKSSVDAVTEARKLQAVISGFDALHGELCFFQQEVNSHGGEGQEVPGREETRPNESGGQPAGGDDEGGPASGAPGQRVGRA